MRHPKPFFRKFTQSWYVTFNGRQHPLGKDEDAAWQKYHELMASRRVARPIWPGRIATRCDIIGVRSGSDVLLTMDVDGEASCACGTRPRVVGSPSDRRQRVHDLRSGLLPLRTTNLRPLSSTRQAGPAVHYCDSASRA
jgi:hypothetical protein